jgi:hypothetical protein
MTKLITSEELQAIRQAQRDKKHHQYIEFLNETLTKNALNTHADVIGSIPPTYATMLRDSGYTLEPMTVGGSEIHDGALITRITW